MKQKENEHEYVIGEYNLYSIYDKTSFYPYFVLEKIVYKNSVPDQSDYSLDSFISSCPDVISSNPVVVTVKIPKSLERYDVIRHCILSPSRFGANFDFAGSADW